MSSTKKPVPKENIFRDWLYMEQRAFLYAAAKYSEQPLISDIFETYKVDVAGKTHLLMKRTQPREILFLGAVS